MIKFVDKLTNPEEKLIIDWGKGLTHLAMNSFVRFFFLSRHDSLFL